MKTLRHWAPNGAGYRLALYQTFDEGRLVPGRRPVIIVPGYGMNSFIFSYHPGGSSLEGYLAEQGFEVWRADLREQGDTQWDGGSSNFSLEDLALTDVGVVIDKVLSETRTGAERADIIGCSLGGALMFLHAALQPAHRMATLVSMGSPVRWERVHPLIKVAFSSPRLVGMIRVRGTRKIAELALPVLAKRTPWLLSVYMNPEITDVSAARELVRTVEDPNRHINRQMAEWIQRRDLIVRGVNLSEAIGALDNPFLCVVANGDGVVPRETAAYPFYKLRSPKKKLLEVGTDTIAMAHADLFISREAHQRVFAPLAAWLAECAG
ncbi:MAG: alpha/beta fold hydrolase [Polyangiaceae bacterium]|jgi:pimeloyl-ACP methyl ester carboxylesterase|nr:alpha/beta fold hydrolase [Polyangiaceae bacterium]